jgi:hypothetical protein
MKKLTILILLVFYGCASSTEQQKYTTYKIDCSYGHQTVEVITIDSCEYIYGPWGNATVLTHKGNCTNHKQNEVHSND